MNPRLCLIFSLLLLGGSAGFALDLGGLSKALNKAKEVTDTAKDAGKVVKGGVGIGPEEEKVIGDSVALEIVGQYGGLVRDEDTLQRVNLVGRALARYSDRPDLDWRFGVLDTDTVNAFSAPDGYVFITRALYALAENDDMLAAILSHEIAHITEKHALKIVGRDELFSGGKSLLTKYSGDYREAATKAQQVDAQLQQFDLGVNKIVKTLVATGFDAKTEYAADQAGRRLAAMTGYAPGGLRAVLVLLQARRGVTKGAFSTHPPLAERIKRLPE